MYISTAYAIFGENLPDVREKTVQRQSEKVVMDYVEIPRDFFTMHKFVTLTADVRFVNGLTFVITFGRGVGLMKVDFTPTQMAKQLAYNLTKVLQLHSRAGFSVQTILIDMEFDKLVAEMPSIVINTSAAREHVAEVKRRIRVVKEKKHKQ